MPLLLPLLSMLGAVGEAMSIPAIATFLASLAADIFAMLAKKFGRTLAMNATIILLIVTMTVALIMTINGMFMALSYVVPPYLSQAMALIVPSNLVPCMSLWFSAKTIRWAWTWHFYYIHSVA